MEINKSILYKVAHLARLHIDEHEEEKLIKELGKILDWVEKLRELDTTGVEPVINMSFEQNKLREDVIRKEPIKQEALNNSPKPHQDFFVVPKVLDK